MTRLESTRPKWGWILYDGACGFCFKWVHFWEKILGKAGFALKDLQSASKEGLLTVNSGELLADIRVLTNSGEMKIGAEAYLFVGEKIWWAKPISVLFRLPFLNQIFWAGYRWFNRNRYRVSKYCPLPQSSNVPKR